MIICWVRKLCMCVYVVIIVNTIMSCVIKLHGKYDMLSIVMFVIGVIECQGWCYPKGYGFEPSLKIHKNI